MSKEKTGSEESMRLNKFLSNSGIATRREADDLIKKGLVKINNEVVREMGIQVKRSDEVQFKDETLEWPYKPVYILLNKPKDTLTEGESSQYKTVLQFVKNIEAENLFAAEQMETADLGLLLITNDKNLAKKITNPELKLRKIYLLELNRALSEEDFNLLKNGVELDEGNCKVEEIAFPDEEDHTKVGIELWDNQKDLIKKIFENLSYKIMKLDRTLYGNLTKKDLPRGKWRFLNDKEVMALKRLISA
ncbi:MAG: S4 domain-containing protein [Chitinophagales bacterium]